MGRRLLIRSNTELTRVELPALTHCGDLRIVLNADLASIDLSALTGVGGEVTVTQNDALTSIELSALESVGGERNMGELHIGRNPALCQSIVDAVVEQRHAAGWGGEAGVYGNRDGC